MTNGDKARESLAKLSDYKIAHLIDFCGLYDECDDCPMNGMKKCGGSTPTVKQLWLKQEVSEDGTDEEVTHWMPLPEPPKEDKT